MKLHAGNYVERADGAVYVAIEDSKLYFCNSQLVAILAGDGTFYRLNLQGSQGITSKRIRAALLFERGDRQAIVSAPELRAIADAIIFNAASDMINKQITKGE